MKNSRFLLSILAGFFFLILLVGCTSNNSSNVEKAEDKTGNFKIGWASTDITPDKPALIIGQYHARISEGVRDRLTVTALALESGKGQDTEKSILISCDLGLIADDLRDAVRELLKKSLPEVESSQIMLNATHTHTGPQYSVKREQPPLPEYSDGSGIKGIYGIELNAMPLDDVFKFISIRIAEAAEQAWKSRKSGGISYGLGHAVVGHNRLVVDLSGNSVMYGNVSTPQFSHIEGSEDHSVNLLYTWDMKKNLIGVAINVACPAQVSEQDFLFSADYWNETRIEVRKKLSKDVYILPQCSAAGDQSPHIILGAKAEARMQRIMGSDSIDTGWGSMGRRKQIARDITDAVTSVFPYMKDNIEWDPKFVHRMVKMELSRRLIGVEDVNGALKEAAEFRRQYEQKLLELKENPGMKDKPRWYMDITMTYRQMMRGYSVRDRYELEKVQHKIPVEINIVRIGDVVFASNPVELYMDYGNRIKGRSPAIQTFLVQLSGSGSYLPPTRSITGGSYGAVPASTILGPEGGQELVEKTLEIINNVWTKN